MRNLCLHAYKVIFTHPITKEKIVIEAKMPKYMNIKKKVSPFFDKILKNYVLYYNW